MIMRFITRCIRLASALYIPCASQQRTTGAKAAYALLVAGPDYVHYRLVTFTDIPGGAGMCGCERIAGIHACQR